MNQRKRNRTITPTEKAIQSELNMSKFYSKGQITNKGDDSELISMSHSSNLNEQSELLSLTMDGTNENDSTLIGSDSESEFNGGVSISSTQKDKCEENKVENENMSRLEKEFQSQVLIKIIEHQNKEFVDLRDEECTGCQALKEKVLNAMDKLHKANKESALKEGEVKNLHNSHET